MNNYPYTWHLSTAAMCNKKKNLKRLIIKNIEAYESFSKAQQDNFLLTQSLHLFLTDTVWAHHIWPGGAAGSHTHHWQGCSAHKQRPELLPVSFCFCNYCSCLNQILRFCESAKSFFDEPKVEMPQRQRSTTAILCTNVQLFSSTHVWW